MYTKHFKRLMDVVLSLAALLALSPMMAVVALLVRIKLGSPVIFNQVRPGMNGKDGKERLFTLYKFRSMTNGKDNGGNLLSDEDRLTHFGLRLRDTSLDELPELWNILKGDMSIVGPRPLLVRDMVFMTDEQRNRHNVRPGLSGWAQVNGRNDIMWEDKLRLDLEYIKRISLLFDLRIILITIKKVIKTESITFEGMATAEDLGDYLLRTGRIDSSYYHEKVSETQKILESIYV